MGDRSNVFVQQVKTDKDSPGGWEGIGVYAHWDGERLHTAAIEAAKKAEGRIGDHSYYARIFVHNLLDAVADPDEEAGHGLWSVNPDDVGPMLVFNAGTGRHWHATCSSYRDDPQPGQVDGE